MVPFAAPSDFLPKLFQFVTADDVKFSDTAPEQDQRRKERQLNFPLGRLRHQPVEGRFEDRIPDFIENKEDVAAHGLTGAWEVSAERAGWRRSYGSRQLACSLPVSACPGSRGRIP